MQFIDALVAAGVVVIITACGPANAVAGPAKGSPSLVQPARTPPADGAGGVASDYASAPLGTVSITLRGGAQTIALVVPRSGDLLPWSQSAETPYIAEIIARKGKGAAPVKKMFRDGVWGTVSATAGANRQVTLKIDVKDTRLVKMDHSTFVTLGTIDRPEWQGFEFHQTINLGDGESASLGSSEKTVATVSWRSM
ncbi:hypothetical protein AA12717_0867 [Gluconacetobacter sacchari DSM 12717]|uniref:Lipoprotein n=2 Tax=Gluconacetobacter sacchari TaxID=92759 RepID=A0A7W4NS22_9PROT|nr:hypothetical protein [Gluconacetobacter sacchari]MBB2161623.1 hypothetical protein [Gluconacetobacter sacchari]GBQ21392.1 hypothetical protein AA12717_0867 [Gluconacetobacter sacchari DSM 12717]